MNIYSIWFLKQSKPPPVGGGWRGLSLGWLAGAPINFTSYIKKIEYK